MKRLRYLTLAGLLLSAVLLGISTLVQSLRRDNTLPTIQVPDAPLVLSLEDYSSRALLRGLTAWDEKDGDLTDHILLMNVTQENGKDMKATYSVVDSNHHIVSASRIVTYSDYEAPKFHLASPLRYNTGSTIRVLDRLTATDLLDGDISNRIKVTANSVSPRYEGVYPVTFTVTNSLGDTSSITLDIEIHTPTAGEPTIVLSEYLVYSSLDGDFEPRQYLKSVRGGDIKQVLIEPPEDGYKKGVNQVTYFARAANGTLGSTVLYVVME